jgi:hypothetical protein
MKQNDLRGKRVSRELTATVFGRTHPQDASAQARAERP